MRMMVVFEKGYDLRFIGHLDLMRTVQRGLRRSELPIAYSKGFNPHIRLSFAAPLSVGIIGECELMELPLTENIEPDVFNKQLNKALPPSLVIKDSCPLPEGYPTLMSLVAGSSYSIYLPNNAENQLLLTHFADFNALERYEITRRTKKGDNLCDIKPFVISTEYDATPEEIHISLRTQQLQEGTLKPMLWLTAFATYANCPCPPSRIIRTHILAKSPRDRLVPMEDVIHAG